MAINSSAQASVDTFMDESRDEIIENNSVVLVLMKNEETDIAIDDIVLGSQLETNPSIEVQDHGSFWHITAKDELVIDTEELSESLGREYNVYDFMVNVAASIGRAYTDGDKFIVTSKLIGLE